MPSTTTARAITLPLGTGPDGQTVFHMAFLLLSAVIVAAPDTVALVGSTALALAVLGACAVLSRIGRNLKPYIDARADHS